MHATTDTNLPTGVSKMTPIGLYLIAFNSVFYHGHLSFHAQWALTFNRDSIHTKFTNNHSHAVGSYRTVPAPVTALQV